LQSINSTQSKNKTEGRRGALKKRKRWKTQENCTEEKKIRGGEREKESREDGSTCPDQ
jgi:hypothetical protein